MRTSKPISVSLGKQQQVLDSLLASGDFDSASEALRAGLRALQRERDAIDQVLKARIRESLDDPRPSIPADEVFANLKALHSTPSKDVTRGA